MNILKRLFINKLNLIPSLGELVDGQWGEWGTWSACSKTCDGGETTRSRECNDPAPSDGGSYCVGDSEQTDDCNVESCPVDGQWSEWSSWSSCTKTCGGGEATRTRECNNPTPTNGGSDCDGNSQDIEECMVEACPGNILSLSLFHR